MPALFRNQTHRSEFAVYPHTVNHGSHSFARAFFAVKRGVAALGAEGVFIHSEFKFGVDDRYIGYLACGVANMMNIFQPQVLCIGGGVCGQGDNLLKPLSELVFAEQYAKTAPQKTRLVIATLGNDAGIVGAAAL